MSKYTAERIALDIIKSGINLPQLPAVSQRLLFLARQPIENIDVTSFSRLIEGDPALTAKILRLANSSFFGTIKTIVGIRQAIMHMGLEEAISSVYNFFYRDALPGFPQLEGLSGKDYWDHSWACATANRMLGHPCHNQMAKAMPGELYIIGLLHGIGKLFLAIYRPEDFQRCLKYSKDSNQPLEHAEIKIFATTDTEIAYNILQQWKFPAHICSAIRHYRSPFGAGKEHRGIAALTQLAYFITNISGIGSNGDEFTYDLSQTYISENWALPLAERKQHETVINDIYSTLKKKSAALNLNIEPEQQNEAPPQEKSNKSNSQQSHRKQGLMGRLLSLVR